MSLLIRRRGFVLGTAATGLGLAAGVRPAYADGPLKVGFIYVGPASDNGWTYRHDVARKEVEPAAPGTLEERTLRLEKLMRASLEIQARLIKTSIASLGLSLILLTMFLSR